MLHILHLMYDNSAPNCLHHFDSGGQRAVPTGFRKVGSKNRAQGALVEIDVSAHIFGMKWITTLHLLRLERKKKKRVAKKHGSGGLRGAI